jgi:hypothetical protein
MRLTIGLAMIALLGSACSKNKPKGPGKNDLSVSSVSDGGLDSSASCEIINSPCVGNGDCCSGSCDLTAHICIATSGGNCGAPGATCTVPTDCCNLDCVSGKCGAVGSCISDNQPCGANVTGVCCSGTCGANGTCTPLNTNCLTAGNACTPMPGVDGGAGSCCSGLCRNNVCAIGASYCTQTGDVCYRASDCCTGVCTIPTGATAGTCAALNTPVSCAIDGTICNGCGTCCSRLCAPFAASGVNICQPASGCHVYGDLCKKDSDCCGGEDCSTGLPGAGTVVCTMISGAGGLGYCDHPNASTCPGSHNSCDPEGNVCHFKNYACSNSSDRNDCCACINSKGCCVLDNLGIPRCNAIKGNDGGSCIPMGGACTFSGECCNGVPCLPDNTGTLKCANQACVPSGGVCTTTGDCCNGFTCLVSPGSLSGVCGTVYTGGTGDGGAPTTDMAQPPTMCAQIGQSCASNTCCAGLTCTNANGPCAGGTGAGCTCSVYVP